MTAWTGLGRPLCGLHFEPSLDALSLQSNVTSSIQSLSLVNTRTAGVEVEELVSPLSFSLHLRERLGAGSPPERSGARTRGSFLVDPHMGSGSLLVRKVLVQTANAFLNSPQFCAVQFSFE